MFELLQFPVEMNIRGSKMEKEYQRSFDKTWVEARISTETG